MQLVERRRAAARGRTRTRRTGRRRGERGQPPPRPAHGSRSSRRRTRRRGQARAAASRRDQMQRQGQLHRARGRSRSTCGASRRTRRRSRSIARSDSLLGRRRLGRDATDHRPRPRRRSSWWRLTLGFTGVPEAIVRVRIGRDHIMMTRRIFLKNGSAALVSLGFTPAFIARAAQAAQARQKILVAIFQRGAVDGLNMVVPFGERAYYASRPSIAIPTPGAPDGALDLDGFFGLHPRMASLAALLQGRQPRDRPRVRLARRHALALRRAGLHGERHARRQEHARRLDEPLPAREGSRRTLVAVPRRGAHAGAAPLAAGHRRRRSRSASSASSAIRAGQDTDDDVERVRVAVRAGRRRDARRDRPRSVRRRQDAEGRESRRLRAGQRRRVSALGLRRCDAADRADRQGRPRPRSRVRRARPVGPSRQRGRIARARSRIASTISRAASPRSPATWAIAWPTSSS